MEIIQFDDRNLAHYSYAIISEGKIALVDPARDPQPYYDLAKEKNASIVAVIETHPHADFISSHVEISKNTGADIYVSKLLNAEYDHKTFDDGDTLMIGGVQLKALNTPGHSPDSISILAVNEEGKEEAIFSGDTLFIGDCGRPDLRESAGAITSERRELASQMYHSLRDKFLPLADDILVYPAHGAGSLCGKGLSSANSSTMGAEKAYNWSLQPATEEAFINELLANQPFVPKYFPNSVELNKNGAPAFSKSIASVSITKDIPENLQEYVIVDARSEQDFKNGHLKNSINLMEDTKFETWLGSVISPGEKFYLLADNMDKVQKLIHRIAKIGYEGQVEKAFVAKDIEGNKEDKIALEEFNSNKEAYTIVDVRNVTEVISKKVFENTIEIPLPELRERVGEIPLDKPIVVHCAGGYRSAAAASIIKNSLHNELPVFDLSYAIKNYN